MIIIRNSVTGDEKVISREEDDDIIIRSTDSDEEVQIKIRKIVELSSDIAEKTCQTIVDGK